MSKMLTFNVSPRLPKILEPLRELAYNLWWTWEPDARRLFRELDIELWGETNHNPVRMLQLCKQARFLEIAKDDDYLHDLTNVYRKFKAYMARTDTYGKNRPTAPAIAYFSAEFGFHESVPNYSGGLGILSGDHCKSASDLDLNFCGVTLLYRHGYFKQQINREGCQEAVSLNQNFHHLPLGEAKVGDAPLFVTMEIDKGTVTAKVWKLQVGRIRLYLLDTDIDQNTPEDRRITEHLYGGDLEMRIRQEMVLGIGGVRALDALDITPKVYHMNEGHSAFLSVERIRQLVQGKNLDYYAALQLVASSNVFTTHTPVPAGHDAFPQSMMKQYFSKYVEDFRISFGDFFRLGQSTVNANDSFSMTILALRTSRHANGVSKLHGDVSQRLWQDVWTDVPPAEVPITYITNGVHAKTWIAPEFQKIYAKYLGTDWDERLTEPDYWLRIADIPNELLWETHQLLKARLIDFVRERLQRQRTRIGEAPEKIRQLNTVLNVDVLTIGFARRFATYKRGTLLFSKKDRLIELIRNSERPVQFIFAGKAHPKDEFGQKFIREIYQMSREADIEHAVVFVEYYDTYIGRRLCQGVDLWLNNPIRPLEASGTSGMKVALNGGLNFSVLDGWWYEGYNEKNGWPIGREITGGDIEFQNEVDVNSLFNILENQIIPLYYAKPDGRLPVAWIQLMRESIRSITPAFNTHRMVKEYVERLYEPAASAHEKLGADAGKVSAELAWWKHNVRVNWSQIRIESIETFPDANRSIFVGDQLEVAAKVYLGPLNPSEVRVQAYVGETDNGTLLNASSVELVDVEKGQESGVYRFKGIIAAKESGSYAFNVRVTPTHPHLIQDHELRLITWAKDTMH